MHGCECMPGCREPARSAYALSGIRIAGWLQGACCPLVPAGHGRVLSSAWPRVVAAGLRLACGCSRKACVGGGVVTLRTPLGLGAALAAALALPSEGGLGGVLVLRGALTAIPAAGEVAVDEVLQVSWLAHASAVICGAGSGRPVVVMHRGGGCCQARLHRCCLSHFSQNQNLRHTKST
jgi:hypothetical protein